MSKNKAPEPSITIAVEYAPETFYESYYRRLDEKLMKLIPDAAISGGRGRQGSYEITVNGRLVYSKIGRGFFPKQRQVLGYCLYVVKEGKEPEVVPPFDYLLCGLL